MSKPSATKLRVNGRNYTVKVYEVGQRFAHAASVKIGADEFRSRDVPFGMRRAAIDNLIGRVQEVHPAAVES